MAAAAPAMNVRRRMRGVFTDLRGMGRFLLLALLAREHGSSCLGPLWRRLCASARLGGYCYTPLRSSSIRRRSSERAGDARKQFQQQALLAGIERARGAL